MDLGLQGKVVLVTGASGGIGEATVRAFSREGAKIVIHYGQNKAAAEALQQSLTTESITLSADVADEKSVDQLFASAMAHFGLIDVVVANAGIFPFDDMPIDAMPVSRFDEVIAVNLKGAWLTARAYFKVLRETRPASASLVFAGSTAGIFGEAGHSEYAATKAAINTGLTMTLKNEIVRIVPNGRVNTVAPGWTWTAMTERLQESRATVVRALQTRSHRRVGLPNDVAQTIVWLASDAAAGHITGEVVAVAGGMEGRVLWNPEEIKT